MPAERLSMRKTKEILRLKWVEQRRHRHIARAAEVGVGTVSEVVRRAGEHHLDWPSVEALPEAKLEAVLYGDAAKQTATPLPDPLALYQELKWPGVTLALLYEEYLGQHPDGSSYSQFCRRFARWRRCQKVVMHQEHRAGEKMFTDFSGKKPHWVDPKTGEMHAAELFVAVLGASNYTYVEATGSQRIEHWIAAHVHAWEFFGGVAALTVPDQLKSGGSQACRYEPVIQRTYQECAQHYGTLIVPARPRRPREKGRVERPIQYLRTSFFADVEDLNAQFRQWREEVAHRRPQPVERQGSVGEACAHERQFLLALPENPFEAQTLSVVRSGKTPYLRFDRNRYSIPHTLVRKPLTVVADVETVRILDGHDTVAQHRRSWGVGQLVEEPAHIAALVREKRAARELKGRDLLRVAVPETDRLCEQLALRGDNLGGNTVRLLHLLDDYGPEELRAAVATAIERAAWGAGSVAYILEQRRRVRGQKPHVRVELPRDPRVRDLRVQSHDLGGYDALINDEDDEQ